MRVRMRVWVWMGVWMRMRVRVRVGMRLRLVFRSRRGHEGIGERTGTGNGQTRGDQATDETSTIDSPSQVTLYEFLIRHDVTPGDLAPGQPRAHLMARPARNVPSCC